MPGTIAGGKKAAKKNKQLYGPNYYHTIGKMGGEISRGGGFAKMDKDRLKEISIKGGNASWQNR